MNSFWSDGINNLKPYVPGEQPPEGEYIKLNSNESPFAPSPLAVKAMQNAINGGLQLYPDSDSDSLRQTVADYYQIAKEEVFVGNGSDEALAHAFKALFAHSGKKIVFPDMTYSFYPVYAGLFDIKFQEIPLDENFCIDIEDYKKLSSTEVSTIIFPNPNAPTGINLALSKIEELLKAQPNILIAIDEAYLGFGAQSAVNLIKKYSNLIVFQTISKARSLAGIRVGFAMAQSQLLEALVRVKNSFNSYPIDRIAQAGAKASFQDEEYFRNTCQSIVNVREYLSDQLVQLGFKVLPSKTNFVFASHPTYDATEIMQALREDKILVRHFKHKRSENYLRITIGLQEHCEKLVQCLKELINDN